MVLIFFFNLFNPFSPGKIEKHGFCDSNNSTNFKHRSLGNNKYKVYQPGYH